MTQLDRERVIFDTSMKRNSGTNGITHDIPKYYVNEPLGKRPACNDSSEDMLDGAPKAKRRFEKVNAFLESFSISNDQGTTVSLESSSDEEMLEEDDAPSCSQADVIIEEPEDSLQQIKVNHDVLKYFDYLKKNPDQCIPKPTQPLRGNEVTIWRPVAVVDPFADSNMSGRINEIEDDEVLPDQIGDVCVAFPDDTSPELSPLSLSNRSSPQIIELSDSAASSPLEYGSETDWEMETD